MVDKLRKIDEYGVDRTGNWLQLFADPPEDEDDLGDEDLEGDEDEEGVDPDEDSDRGEEDGQGEEGDEGDKPVKGKQDPKTPDKDDKGQRRHTDEDVNRIVQKRLARAKEQWEVERSGKVDEAALPDTLAEKFDTPSMPVAEMGDALRLWNYLKHNPDINDRVTKALNEKAGTVPRFTGQRRQAPPTQTDTGNPTELRLVKLELRQTDKVFRRYESKIMQYAEDEGLDVKTERDLRMATKLWKADNQALLAANQQHRDGEKAKKGKQAAQAARGVPRKGSGKGGPRDYSKMSDEDILREEGLSLFTDDDD